MSEDIQQDLKKGAEFATTAKDKDSDIARVERLALEASTDLAFIAASREVAQLAKAVAVNSADFVKLEGIKEIIAVRESQMRLLDGAKKVKVKEEWKEESDTVDELGGRGLSFEGRMQGMFDRGRAIINNEEASVAFVFFDLGIAKKMAKAMENRFNHLSFKPEISIGFGDEEEVNLNVSFGEQLQCCGDRFKDERIKDLFTMDNDELVAEITKAKQMESERKRQEEANKEVDNDEAQTVLKDVLAALKGSGAKGADAASVSATSLPQQQTNQQTTNVRS